MLPLFECFRKYDLPGKLANELVDSAGVPLSTIDNINRINIFLGANNNGKSLLARELLRTRSKCYYGNENWEKITDTFNLYSEISADLKLIVSIQESFVFANTNGGVIVDLYDVELQREKLQQYEPDYNINALIGHLNTMFSAHLQFDQYATYRITTGAQTKNLYPNNHIEKELIEKLLQVIVRFKVRASTIITALKRLSFDAKETFFTKIYIPAIRTLRPFGGMVDIEKRNKRRIWVRLLSYYF
jgi:hypothetical protein